MNIFNKICLKIQTKKKHKSFLIFLKKNKIYVGKNCEFTEAKFGFNCRIMDNTILTCSNVGSLSYIGFNSNLPNCNIGKFSSIGDNVKVIYMRHPTKEFISTHPLFWSSGIDYFAFEGGKASFNPFLFTNNEKYAEIGSDCWIGSDVILKGGIRIGDGAIVGMGAVVTKDVPPYSIVGGVPAKIISYRYSTKIIEKLQNIKWWDWDINVIKNRVDDFSNINQFIEKYYNNNDG